MTTGNDKLINVTGWSLSDRYVNKGGELHLKEGNMVKRLQRKRFQKEKPENDSLAFLFGSPGTIVPESGVSVDTAWRLRTTVSGPWTHSQTNSSN